MCSEYNQFTHSRTFKLLNNGLSPFWVRTIYTIYKAKGITLFRPKKGFVPVRKTRWFQWLFAQKTFLFGIDSFYIPENESYSKLIYLLLFTSYSRVFHSFASLLWKDLRFCSLTQRTIQSVHLLKSKGYWEPILIKPDYHTKHKLNILFTNNLFRIL